MTFPSGATGFQNPIVGGDGALLRRAIKSPDYIPGVQGWSINKDGTAEFNDATIRGTLVEGTLTGAHVIIDTTSIRIYDTSANLVGDWLLGSGNLTVYKPGDLNHYLSIQPTNPNTVTGGPVIFMTPDQTLYDPGWVYGNEAISGDGSLVPTLYLVSPSNKAFPTSQGFFVLHGRNNSGARLPHIETNMDIDSDGWFFSQNNKTIFSNVNSTALAPGANQDILTISFPTKALERYEITAQYHGVLFGSASASVVGNLATTSIRRNGTQLAGHRIIGAPSVSSTQQGSVITFVDMPGLSVGNTQYTFNLGHEAASLAATCLVNGSATSPIQLTVKGF